MTALVDARDILAVMMVKMFVQYYEDGTTTDPDFPYWQETYLRFSDGADRKYYLNNEEYVGLGSLVSITSTTSELKASSTDLTITLSGIPDTDLRSILNSRMKGSEVEIFRAYFDPMTLEPITLETGNNTTSRYKGFVNNFSIEEDYDFKSGAASNKAIITCSSTIDYLQDKLAGRKTNQSSQQRWFPNDLSMNRVYALQNSTFDFGKRR